VIKNYCVYILTNYKNTVFYIGVTNDLERKITEHKSGLVKGFTQRYKLEKLVYFEEYPNMTDAINEKNN